MEEAIEIDPEKLGGTPCFKGTRVPIKNLFDYLEEGETVEEFINDFPPISHQQVERILEQAKHFLLNHYHENFNRPLSSGEKVGP